MLARVVVVKTFFFFFFPVYASTSFSTRKSNRDKIFNKGKIYAIDDENNKENTQGAYLTRRRLCLIIYTITVAGVVPYLTRPLKVKSGNIT